MLFAGHNLPPPGVKLEKDPNNEYNFLVVAPLYCATERGCNVDYFVAFVVSVGASVVAYYLCKWLDRCLSKPKRQKRGSDDSDN